MVEQLSCPMPADNRDVHHRPVAGRCAAHVVSDGGPASRTRYPVVCTVYGLVASHREHLSGRRGADLHIGGGVVGRGWLLLTDAVQDFNAAVVAGPASAGPATPREITAAAEMPVTAIVVRFIDSSTWVDGCLTLHVPQRFTSPSADPIAPRLSRLGGPFNGLSCGPSDVT